MGKHFSKPFDSMSNKNSNMDKKIIVIAMFDYESRTNTDISFMKGDLMELSDNNKEEWCIALHLSHKIKGWFPSKYVAKIDSLESKELEIEM